MTLKELQKCIKERTKEYFDEDEKDWIEHLCVVTLDENGEFKDYYKSTTDIFIAKDNEGVWEPTIYWVKVKREIFNSLLDGIDENFGFLLEWGDSSGFSDRSMDIHCVTKYYVYLSPINSEEA